MLYSMENIGAYMEFISNSVSNDYEIKHAQFDCQIMTFILLL